VNVQERLRPWESGSDAGSEYVFEIAHGVIWLNAVTGFEEGGFLSDTLTGNVFFGVRSSEDHKGGRFIVSHFSQKTREMGHPRFRDYLRMPSFPMTVL